MQSSKTSQKKKTVTRRTSYQRKLKGFRIDKRIPRRFSVQTEEDLGQRKVIDRWTTPRIEHEHRDYPKEENGAWKIVINRNGFKVKKSLTEDRYYWYFNDQYQGELSSPDMYQISLAFLQVLDAVTTVVYRKVRGRRYERYMLRSSRNFYEKPKWTKYRKR